LSLFQQLFNATMLGIILGLLAVRSRSLLPGIVFHLLNNALTVLTGSWMSDPIGRRIAGWLYRNPTEGLYHRGLVALGAAVSVTLLVALAWQGGGTDSPRRHGGSRGGEIQEKARLSRSKISPTIA
jgi:sodium transport system permease protein